jgi:hypothetical protein
MEAVIALAALLAIATACLIYVLIVLLRVSRAVPGTYSLRFVKIPMHFSCTHNSDSDGHLSNLLCSRYTPNVKVLPGALRFGTAALWHLEQLMSMS